MILAGLKAKELNPGFLRRILYGVKITLNLNLGALAFD